MSLLTDATTRLKASADALIAAVANLPSSAEVAQAATDVNAVSDEIDATVAKLNPPPPPAQ